MTNLIENIYLHSPMLVKQVAVGLYGYKLKKMRYGGQVSDEYSIPFLHGKTRSWLDNYQLQRLNDILDIAQKIPFYKRRNPDKGLSDISEIFNIPVLTKIDIQSAGIDIVNSHIPKKEKIKGNTSGSTGTPLTFYHSVESIRKMYSLYRSFKHWHGIKDGAKRIRFGGRLIVPFNKKKPPFWMKDFANNTLYLSLLHMSETTLNYYVDAIEDFHADEFSGYPSSIYTLADYCLRHDIKTLRPRGIITDSETLLDYQRDVIEEAFNCRIRDYYGISETQGIFAGQCPEGNYHLIPQAAYVEILDDNGKPAPIGQTGHVHVTSLTNDCMPLIRYRVGDQAAISEEYCTCGLQTRLLQNLEGRTDDIITLSDGRKIGRLDHIFKQGRSIKEVQIIQKNPGNFIFRVVPGVGFNDKTMLEIEGAARKRLGRESHIKFEVLDQIPRTSRGKFKSVVVKS